MAPHPPRRVAGPRVPARCRGGGTGTGRARGPRGLQTRPLVDPLARSGAPRGPVRPRPVSGLPGTAWEGRAPLERGGRGGRAPRGAGPSGLGVGPTPEVVRRPSRGSTGPHRPSAEGAGPAQVGESEVPPRLACAGGTRSLSRSPCVWDGRPPGPRRCPGRWGLVPPRIMSGLSTKTKEVSVLDCHLCVYLC